MAAAFGFRCRYYEAVYILFHTGVRISEFCGLTISDLNMEARIIDINHQLQRTSAIPKVTMSGHGIRVKHDLFNDAKIYEWWLRSAYDSTRVFRETNEGYIVNFGADAGTILISPAFNVNLSSVLFSSLISGTAGRPGAEYKLTLKDDILNIVSNDITSQCNKVTMTCTITGTHKWITVKVN